MVQVTENYAAMPSRKHSGRRARTQMLVVHSAEAPLERGYAKSLTNWSNTTAVEASWNAFADPGVLVRAVNTYFAAWHASWANSTSVGYETAAYAAFTRATWLTLEGRRMLERLAIEMAVDAEIFDIPLRWLTGAQVNAVRAGNTAIKGLAAHRQVDPANRTDPGNGFPYGYLLKRIKAHSRGDESVIPVEDEVIPIEEEEEPMPELNRERYFENQPVKKGDWYTVKINDKGHTSLISGNNADKFTATFRLWLTGIPNGGEAKVRLVCVDTDNHDRVTEDFGTVEVHGSHGGESAAYAASGRVGRHRHRIRIQVFCYDDDVAVSSVRAETVYWKQAH